MTSAHQQSSPPGQVGDPGDGQTGGPRWHPGTVAAALAALLLVLVVVGSALSGPWQVTEPDPVPVTTVPVDESTATPSAEPTPEDFLEDAEDQGDTATRVLMTIFGALLLLALVAAARKVIQRRLLPWRPGDKEPGPDQGDPATSVVSVVPVAAIEEAAVLAAQRLRASTDPTDDVVAAWVALERASEESGTARTPAQTPTEFTVAVLGTTSVSPTAVQTLLRLYHRARFTEHRITPAEGSAAADALEQLVADLRSTSPADPKTPVAQTEGSSTGDAPAAPLPTGRRAPGADS